MFQLIYTSTPTVLLTRAKFNERALQYKTDYEAANITGAMVMTSATILHVLEGEEHSVRDIFQTLEKDECHKNCEVLLTRYCDVRLFQNWSVGVCKEGRDKAYEIKMTISMLKARKTKKERLERLIRRNSDNETDAELPIKHPYVIEHNDLPLRVARR